jgi:putative intracellular protease/amidase
MRHLVLQKKSRAQRSLVAPFGAFITALALVLGATPAIAADHGKVLIILSSANELTIQNNKTYSTGYYLDELAIPVRKLIDAGYEPVFANPKGNAVSYAPDSNNKMFFGGDDTVRAEAVKFVEGIPELKHPKTFESIKRQGTAEYAGVFIPGGHAPLEDLGQNKTLGEILVTFHEKKKPTAILCHGPIALLSTVSDPGAYRQAMIAGDFQGASKIAAGWPYAGYRLTVFSSGEEKALEGQLGGPVLFYPADALAQAGAHVDRLGAWQSNVIEDRELLSGQQPFSSEALGDAFVTKLKAAQMR